MPQNRTFSSPSDYNACTNKKVVIVHKKEIRKGAFMSGVFCKEKIVAGEFICAWNGIQILDSDEIIQKLTNSYDLTKYALSFPGKKSKQMVFSCVCLDKNGLPPRITTQNSKQTATNISLAVFLNEPSPQHVATYDAVSDVVTIFRKSRNTANICLKTQFQRNGVLCPVMFASRDITIGEELTWDYGDLYDRRQYTIDEEKHIFNVSDTSYLATENDNNICRLTCDTVHFKKGLEISDFHPDIFILEDELSETDRSNIEFRTSRYYAGLDYSDNSEDASKIESDVSETIGRKRQKKPSRKKQRHLSRRTITIEDVQKEEENQLVKLRKDVDRSSEDVITRLKTYQLTRKNVRVHALLKNIVLPALATQYEGQYDVRKDFFLPRHRGIEFIRDNESMWHDILKMQQGLFANLKSLTDFPLISIDKMIEKFNPNTYTEQFINQNTNKPETILDWDLLRDQFPLTHFEGMRFLNNLIHIGEMIRRYNKNYDMYQIMLTHVKVWPYENEISKQIQLVFDISRDMLHSCAYKMSHTPSLINIMTRSLKLMVKQLESISTEKEDLVTLTDIFPVHAWTVIRDEIQGLDQDLTTEVEIRTADAILTQKFMAILNTLIELTMLVPVYTSSTRLLQYYS